MRIPFFQVDAFTSKLFGGNPAGVCPLKEWLDDKTMQQIAAENNLSETAFFVPHQEHYEIRWFTPVTEVDLCGHATLATAHVLYRHLHYRHEVIRFTTRFRGDLSVAKSRNIIVLNFPASDPQPVPYPDPLIKALGMKPVELYKTRDFLAVFNREEDIISITPDFRLLQQLGQAGIIITAPGNKCDFVSRFFAPAFGINEDPVTGSAHTTLIPYWASRLKKTDLYAHQVSERKGELYCGYSGDRVTIGGQAVTFIIGEINLGEK
jgi:PhzF family phenazine biosynthesis protein